MLQAPAPCLVPLLTTCMTRVQDAWGCAADRATYSRGTRRGAAGRWYLSIWHRLPSRPPQRCGEDEAVSTALLHDLIADDHCSWRAASWADPQRAQEEYVSVAGAQGRPPCCGARRHRRRISAETAGPNVGAVDWTKHVMAQLLCGPC